MRARYTARVVRSGDWWAVDVPEIRGVHTQARRLEKVEATVRDAIALMLEVPEDSFDVDVRVELPPKLRKKLEAAGGARKRADAAQREASEILRDVSGALIISGLTVRDAGHLLGMSHQRVAQLANTAARPRPPGRRAAGHSPAGSSQRMAAAHAD